MLKWFKRILKAFGSGNIILVTVQALTTCNQFCPPEQQIEAIGIARISRIRVCVEGTLCHRVARDKQKIALMFLERPITQNTLMFGREIRFAQCILNAKFIVKHLLSVRKENMWNSIWNLRHFR